MISRATKHDTYFDFERLFGIFKSFLELFDSGPDVLKFGCWAETLFVKGIDFFLWDIWLWELEVGIVEIELSLILIIGLGHPEYLLE